MNGMERIQQAIEKNKNENGDDYDKILISEKFYNQLHEESSKKGSKSPVLQVKSSIIDFRGMEIVRGASFDFKLLP